MHIVRNEQDAQDVAQEVFIKVHKYLGEAAGILSEMKQRAYPANLDKDDSVEMTKGTYPAASSIDKLATAATVQYNETPDSTPHHSRPPAPVRP